MSESATRNALDPLRTLFARDAAKVTAMFLGIWALFYAFGLALGYGNNGLLALVRRVTFLSAVYGIVVLALNIQWGYAGLFNIGVAGFMAVGAYTAAMLSSAPSGMPPGLGLPLPVGILGGMLAATVVGLVAALPALRLKADYLAIVTVALSEIIRIVYNTPAFADITGGASGFDNLPTSPVNTLLLRDPTSTISEPTAVGSVVFSLFEQFGIQRFTAINTVYTVGVLVALLVVYLILERTGKSPYGRVLKAIREDETAAQSLGKDTQNFKVRAFALGCGLMGLAGILWFAMGPRASITPTTFRPNITFYIFIALIIGGAGSNTGSVLGGALFASLLFEAPPVVRNIITDAFDVSADPANLVEALAPIVSGNLAPLAGFLLNNIDTLRFMGMGLLLVVLVQRRPDGLLGARKETAAGVSLAADTRPGGQSAANGGDDDE
ncbi:ABC-type transport system permease protein (probable substrate branched-chain amino acids) [Halobacterium hubeiense]|uniref:ABC-type transport system permease protein (Probable substrate branched-chain amino acids) n=1 Tax=Halobacterium hubeiense TaxID=1407499 RepID=A0A0U5GYT0_9EURY|nr:branched-chain amino acid ABC transporter permease [Halobacterium hubeiense]CQH51274.1 ABC-type transport system permease protein (probable substrate branched-chain amino acids) [Halobacterium hubeiense]